MAIVEKYAFIAEFTAYVVRILGKELPDTGYNFEMIRRSKKIICGFCDHIEEAVPEDKKNF